MRGALTGSLRGWRSGIRVPCRRTLLCVLLLGGAATAPALAQTPQTAVHPRDIYVGDVFRAVIAVEVPPGARLVFPDTLALGADLEAAGRRELRFDTTATGAARIMAAYPLAAWRPGPASLPPVEVRVIGDGFERAVTARFPAFEVSSLLPADTTGIEPKELKDVLGADRLMWPWLLAAALLAALIAGAVLWRRRQRPRLPLDPRTGVVDPRATALAALTDERGRALAGNGEMRRMYIEMSDTLRYLVAVEMPALSHDLTTTELVARFEGNLEPDRARALRRLLQSADLVKFARARPDAERALEDWRAARAWVESLEPPSPAEADTGLAGTAPSPAAAGHAPGAEDAR